MKISTRARYALRFMIDLADHYQGSPVILRDVAERQQISKRYLEQLATGLKNANLVGSTQGRGGGYVLPREPDEIYVSEIIEASIGAINVVACVNNPKVCSRSDDCPSRSMWERVNKSINEVLESVTLADLCEGVLSIIPDIDGATPCSRPEIKDSA